MEKCTRFLDSWNNKKIKIKGSALGFLDRYSDFLLGRGNVTNYSSLNFFAHIDNTQSFNANAIVGFVLMKKRKKTLYKT